MPKGFLPSLQSARAVELLSVGAGAILLVSLADSPSCLPVTASPRFFDRLDPGIRKLAMITHVVEGDVKQDLSVFLNFCLFALLFRARRNRRRRNAWR